MLKLNLSRGGPAQDDAFSSMPKDVVHHCGFGLWRDVLGHFDAHHPVIDLQRDLSFLKRYLVIFNDIWILLVYGMLRKRY